MRPAPGASRPWLRDACIAAALLILTMAVFAQVGTHDFVDLDDGLYVVENENVRGGLTAENVHWAFTTGRAANWHPLTWLSHQTDVTLFGMDAGAHHIVSVGWHTVNVLLLFGLLRSATGAAWRSALVAALFAVHPAHVESVAWIAERKDVLSTSFWLGSTWLWIVWTRRRTAGWIGSALAVFAAGLMAKPMLITVPVTWLILDVWPLGRTAISWRQRIVEKIPFVALAAASLVVTFLVQQQGGAVASLDRVSIVDRLANAVASFGTYLRVLVWPTNLAAFYPFVLPVPAARAGIGGALLVLGSAAGVVASAALPAHCRRMGVVRRDAAAGDWPDSDRHAVARRPLHLRTVHRIIRHGGLGDGGVGGQIQRWSGRGGCGLGIRRARAGRGRPCPGGHVALERNALAARHCRHDGQCQGSQPPWRDLRQLGPGGRCRSALQGSAADPSRSERGDSHLPQSRAVARRSG